MKFTSLIMSIILIILSCMPCADAENGIQSATGKYSIAEKHSEHHEEKHNDLCSPFCICNCCGAQVLNFAPFNIFKFEEPIAVVINKQQAFYKSHFASMFSGSIWQPPQIV